MSTKQPTGCRACREGISSPPFAMALQPIVDLDAQRVVAHEALVRGRDGQGARHILDQVNKTNLYAFDQACRTHAIALASRLGLEGRLNINFLPNAVYEPMACIRATLEAAARTGFPPQRLTFEMVESEEVAETGHMHRIIEAYRRLGFRVALDDFGTGYSGMARLADLRPDAIKVDRALITRCDEDGTRRAILASLLALGREINVDVVLEGVERLEEVETLRSIGGRFMQGFYFGRPAFEAMVTHSEIPWPGMSQPSSALAASEPAASEAGAG